jgi:hypothetical protein
MLSPLSIDEVLLQGIQPHLPELAVMLDPSAGVPQPLRAQGAAVLASAHLTAH